MRSLAAFWMAAAFLAAAMPMAAGADDAITRLLRSQDEAVKRLPVAPSRPASQNLPGPSVGTRPQGPLPIVMSARIGEHQDRTRLVIELSDPVNLRAFALANPDRVVIDMPEVSWRLGAPPRPSGYGPVKS
ncbi:MAG TPA: AMIN domain-containing protein, partial [Rhizomicrobium sp.]|nr:AMIN domain-containing protein [Rhizomicrobium sp.]